MTKKKEFKKIALYEITYYENDKGDFCIDINGEETKYKKAKAKYGGNEFHNVLVSAAIIENIIHSSEMNKKEENKYIKSVSERIKILKESRMVIK